MEKQNISIFAGTDCKPIKQGSEIASFGRIRVDSPDNFFGGVFGSTEKNIAKSHGNTIQHFSIPSELIMSCDEMDNMLYDAEESAQISNIVVNIAKTELYETLEEEELEELIEYITEEKNFFASEPDMGLERLSEIVGYTEPAEIDWTIQGIRGEVARYLGYAAIDMKDEHGTSTLVLNHPEVQVIEKF